MKEKGPRTKEERFEKDGEQLRLVQWDTHSASPFLQSSCDQMPGFTVPTSEAPRRLEF